MVKLNRFSLNEENGLVSFFVSMIMMIILAILVLSFSQISQRENSSVNKKILSTGAFYAAESGINDAYGIANLYLTSGNTPPSTTSGGSCTPSQYENSSSNVITSSPSTVSYSCLVINSNPSNLVGNEAPGQAFITQLTTSGGATPLGHLNINWYDAASTAGAPCSTYPSMGVFPAYATWATSYNCSPSVLRVDLVDLNDPSLAWTFPSSEAALQSHTITFFLDPQSGGSGTGAYLSAGQVQNQAVLAANCNSSGQCNFNITGLNSEDAFIRIMPIYAGTPPAGQSNDTTITLTATPAMSGAQLEIDSTGLYKDVLKRIQVNVAESQTSLLPQFAIQTNSSICKRLVVGTSFATEDIPSLHPGDVPAVGTFTTATPTASTTDPCDPSY